MTAPRLDPARTALLLMDYQRGIVDLIQDQDTLLERAGSALAAARKAGLTVGFVRVAFEPADWAAVPDRNKSFAVHAAAKRMPADAPETQLHDALAAEPGDLVVRKVRVGSFSTTDLEQQLRAAGVDTLVLAGISTSGVVLSTLRDAADKDFRLLVLSDATADPDPDSHRVLMTKVFPKQADVVTVAEFEQLL